eukprot:4558734-Prorocentrum_lima.AAC.1
MRAAAVGYEGGGSAANRRILASHLCFARAILPRRRVLPRCLFRRLLCGTLSSAVSMVNRTQQRGRRGAAEQESATQGRVPCAGP